MIPSTILAATVMAAVVSFSSGAQAAVQFSGLNEAGLEFGEDIWGPSNVPGALGQNYFAPNPDAVQHAVDSLGANLFRLNIMWERLQPTSMGSLDSGYLTTVKDAVNNIKKTGASVVIDIHDYARYYSQVTTGPVLADLWSRIAQLYANDPQVWFGIMNEPHNIDTATWFSIAQTALSAIRATGANNVVTVPGNCFTGAHSWVSGYCDSGVPNAQAALSVKDPSNNMVFEMHQYLDSDSSGTHSECTQNGAAVLVDATNWLRQNNKKGYLGEIGVGNNANCAAQLDSLLSYMDANSDVWVGYSYWAAGSAWGDYILTVESTNAATDAKYAQIPVIAKHRGTGGSGPRPSTTSSTTSSSSTTTTTTTTSSTSTPSSTSSTTTTTTTTSSTSTTPVSSPPPTNTNPTVTHTVAAEWSGSGWCTNDKLTMQLGTTVKSVTTNALGTTCGGGQPSNVCGLASIRGTLLANGNAVKIVSYGGAGSVDGNAIVFTEKDGTTYYGGTIVFDLPCSYGGSNDPAVVGKTVAIMFTAASPTALLTMTNGSQVTANVKVVSA